VDVSYHTQKEVFLREEHMEKIKLPTAKLDVKVSGIMHAGSESPQTVSI